MATFVDLPVEILQHIIDDVEVIGFESLALCSKHVYAVSSPRRFEHNELKKKYGRLDALSRLPGGNLQLIQDIWDRPLIAQYVTDIFIGDNLGVATPGSPMMLSPQQYPSVYSDYMSAIAAWPDNRNKTQYWRVLPLLLPLLPNLSSLKLMVPWKDSEFTDPILEIVASKCAQILSEAPLRKLKEVTIEATPRDALRATDFRAYINLLAVKKLTGKNVWLIDLIAYDGRKQNHIFPCAVEDIVLESCSVDLYSFTCFIERMKCLKRLKFDDTLEQIDYIMEEGSSAYEFIVELEKISRTTLKELLFFTKSVQKSIPVTLQRFKQLETLGIALELLIPVETKGTEKGQIIDTALHLVDQLPTSIKRLGIVVRFGAPSLLEEVYFGLASHKKRLPNLKEITFVFLDPELALQTHSTVLGRMLFSFRKAQSWDDFGWSHCHDDGKLHSDHRRRRRLLETL